MTHPAIEYINPLLPHNAVAKNIVSQDRLTAVILNNWLLITVYMPCAGTAQRDLLYDDVLYELQALINQYPSCDCLIGGNFNVDLDNGITISRTVNDFIYKNKLHRCDQITPMGNKMTYVNESTNVCSAIDYMLSSSHDKIVAFNILDLDINFSDHLPLMVSVVVICQLHQQIMVICTIHLIPCISRGTMHRYIYVMNILDCSFSLCLKS